ncbi:MAG: ABC transporter ATP-binding protein, partial [Candidatus Limiplasma sp.]|nr:ABC transporter ATP-binding protein [Candidatus Limiplasma sp.]
MIQIENVGKRYGAVRALDGVTLTVEKGSVTGLLGQNGAGTTTLLNILTGYLAPTSGRVLIDGSDVLLNPAQAKRHLGYLPEHPPLYDEMTVQEYLRFAAELKGVEKRAVCAHVDEVMELTGLTQMRRRLIGNLSKGYRQRAGMAQALCGAP